MSNTIHQVQPRKQVSTELGSVDVATMVTSNCHCHCHEHENKNNDRDYSCGDDNDTIVMRRVRICGRRRRRSWTSMSMTTTGIKFRSVRTADNRSNMQAVSELYSPRITFSLTHLLRQTLMMTIMMTIMMMMMMILLLPPTIVGTRIHVFVDAFAFTTIDTTAPSSSSSSPTASASVSRFAGHHHSRRQRHRPTRSLLDASSSSSSSSTVSTNELRNNHPVFDQETVDGYNFVVDENIGSGSYGTVHFLIGRQRSNDENNDDGNDDSKGDAVWYVGKRPWTVSELKERNTNRPTAPSKDADTRTDESNDDGKTNYWKERHDRCHYYWNVEAHCLAKIPKHPQIPTFLGTTAAASTTTTTTTTTSKDQQKQHQQHQQHRWMVFGLVGDGTDTSVHSGTRPRPAPTLQDLMDIDNRQKQHHTLSNVAAGLGLGYGTANERDGNNQYDGDDLPSYSQTLDIILPSLMTVLHHVHTHNVVHRDVKPSNLLVHNGTLLLMDFGSAADLELSTSDTGVGGGGGGGGGGGFMGGLLKKVAASTGMVRVGLEDPSRVAVSPIYSAPETFIDIDNSPTTFDVFSSALIFCQLLFGYLEDRVDAGFHQQLRDSGDGNSGWNLNVWLYNELGTRLRPVGLDQALSYLSERRGLWTLLCDMLSEDPNKRPTSEQVLKRWNLIQEERFRQETTVDGGNTANVLREQHDNVQLQDNPFFEMVVEALEICEIPSVSRPLHYVATFSRSQSLGLVLSEAGTDDDNDGDDDEVEDEVTAQNKLLWNQATSDAAPGEVFVKEIVPHGQADLLGIIQTGDRLSGIGEIPFIDGGFEKALSMLQDQPKGLKNIRLHFDRKLVRNLNEAIDMVPQREVSIKVVDVGAWSSKGRRSTQEDAFVVHEIHDVKDRAVLLAGVMDGHGGPAASAFVSNALPNLLLNGLVIQNRQASVKDALEDSWHSVCNMYQQRCTNDENQECIAQYDAREGILDAETGSKDIIAGTTCSVAALDKTNGDLTVLNCGDSRTLIVDSSNGKLRYASVDHTPQTEEERLLEGIANGKEYSPPQCRLSRWWIKVGEYEYSVGRSLEGPFAASKGIISEADVSVLTAAPNDIILSATDGIFDVMDSSEVAMELSKMRKAKMSARDTARAICALAVKKGSTDNVSATVVFL